MSTNAKQFNIYVIQLDKAILKVQKWLLRGGGSWQLVVFFGRFIVGQAEAFLKSNGENYDGFGNRSEKMLAK